MNIRWKIAELLRPFIPQELLHDWAVEYFNSLHMKIVPPVLDMTIVAHKEVSITLSGRPILLQSGDVVNVEVEKPLPQPRLVPISPQVLH